jgi:antirestriction protein ArdC
MATEARTKLTPEEARTFSRYSVANAGHVESALECGCEAYRDVFTYNRWRALGYQVQRGEKAIKIPVIVEREKEDENGATSRARSFRTSAVFCRHQVADGKPAA